MLIKSWCMTGVNEPLVQESRESGNLKPHEVLIAIAGCGICHTDLGFLYDGVPTRHELPLVLGHEISGTVIETGEAASQWVGKDVIVPAVMPCGACELCQRGRGSICPKQIFPGNDIDGGFSTHVVVPSAGLCPVPDLSKLDIELADLSVIADAVTTPFQSIERSQLKSGDLAIVVGIGGVGTYAVQIAKAKGAVVVAIDVDAGRLEKIADFGASLTLNASEMDSRAMKKAIRGYAKENGLPGVEWKIFETSGSPAGQQTAFSLLVHGAYLGVVGFTPKKTDLRLSNLMAFDAIAQGNWGCLPEHYPATLDLILAGEVSIKPFIERRPMSEINGILAAVKNHEISNRVVLIPEA